MDKKTGNQFSSNCIIIASLFYFLYSDVVCHDKSIKLNIYDSNKQPAQQLEVDVPFIFEITAHNFDNPSQPEKLVGLEDFALSQNSTHRSMMNINGKQSNQTSLGYEAIPHKKGTFTLGPITLKDSNGDLAVSDTITVKVGDSTVLSTKQNLQPYFLQTIINSKSVYIGQKIKLLIRFCYKEDYSNLSFLNTDIQNSHRGFISSKSEPGTTKINDDPYKYEQIIMEIYPEKLGSLLIPSFQTSFVPAMKYQFGFGFGFGMQMQRAVQSNPRSIEVNPLPEHAQYKDVTAIGTFDHLSFQIQKQTGSVGEGIVATMTVQGNGNLEIVKNPQLDLPEGLHYYEGNTSIEKLNTDISRKKFEWIIQADKANTFIIKPQTFTYFNPEKQTYTSLTASGAELTILGSNNKQIKPNQEKSNKEQQKPTPKATPHSYNFQEDEIDHINQTNAPSTSLPTQYKYTSWAIIFLILCIICMISLLVVRNVFKIKLTKTYIFHYIRYNYLLNRYIKQQDIPQIYHLFIELSSRYNLDLQSNELAQTFTLLHLPIETFQQWKEFFATLLYANFSGKMHTIEEQKNLLKQTKHWFAILLSCCKIQKKIYPDNDTIS